MTTESVKENLELEFENEKTEQPKDKPKAKSKKSKKGQLTVLPKKQVQKRQEVSIISPEDMIMKAMDKGMTIEILERLLDLRNRIQKDEAEKIFREAMSNFQAECPVITKTNNVDYTSRRSGTRVKYTYASLDKIVASVKDILGKYGLSYTFTTQQTERSVTATCHVFHVAGYTESTSFIIPIDPEAYMNEAQKVASALTYSKRYAFCNAFGILTGDPDDDGNAFDDPKADAEKIKEAEKAAQEENKKNKSKLVALPKDIRNNLKALGYEKSHAAIEFCKGCNWNNKRIEAELERIKKNPGKEIITNTVNKLSSNAKSYFKDVNEWKDARQVYDYLAKRNFDYETIEKEIKNK